MSFEVLRFPSTTIPRPLHVFLGVGLPGNLKLMVGNCLNLYGFALRDVCYYTCFFDDNLLNAFVKWIFAKDKKCTAISR